MNSTILWIWIIFVIICAVAGYQVFAKNGKSGYFGATIGGVTALLFSPLIGGIVLVCVWFLLKNGDEISRLTHQALQSSQLSQLFPNVNSNIVPINTEYIETNKIFISYRRSDSAEIVGRIYDRLVQQFGSALIFRDIESIPLGQDFRWYLQNVVSNCVVLIVVMGENWTDIKDEDGKNRLHDSNDFVRLEVGMALQRNIPVIPVLLHQAKMPKPQDLPLDLVDLAFRNGTRIRNDPDFNPDMARLIQAINQHFVRY